MTHGIPVLFGISIAGTPSLARVYSRGKAARDDHTLDGGAKLLDRLEDALRATHSRASDFLGILAKGEVNMASREGCKHVRMQMEWGSSMQNGDKLVCFDHFVKRVIGLDGGDDGEGQVGKLVSQLGCQGFLRLSSLIFGTNSSDDFVAPLNSGNDDLCSHETISYGMVSRALPRGFGKGYEPPVTSIVDIFVFSSGC